MHRAIRWFLIALFLLVPLGFAHAADAPAEIAARDVEQSFRSAITAFAYGECWWLWERALSLSRLHTPRLEFCALLEKAKAKPAAGRQVEELRIEVTSLTTATVYARIGMEGSGGAAISVPRAFIFYFEDREWRYQLSDFIGLASWR